MGRRYRQDSDPEGCSQRRASQGLQKCHKCSAGAAFIPTDLDPRNQTRSDARRTYYDPYVSRPNFHVITGQHVTRILIKGVGSNFVVSNPTPGGNENGNGMNGMTSNNGFGFGPGGSTPALDDSTPPPLLRRQSPSTFNLRITGVEVSIYFHCKSQSG